MFSQLSRSRFEAHIDMCIDACIEMCIGARVDVCTDMCLHACVRVCGLRRARRRVRGMVARTQQLAGQARRGGPSQPPTSSQVEPPGRRPVKACQTRPKTGFSAALKKSIEADCEAIVNHSSLLCKETQACSTSALYLLYIGSISALHLLYIGSPSAFTSASPAACLARVYGRAGTRSDTPRRGLPSEACTTDGRYN